MDSRAACWFSRLAVGAVFVMNVTCAAVFILFPHDYTAGFELSGVQGRVIVQSLGILFLMWNVPYIPVLWQPAVHRMLFGVVLVQQAIGVIGETWLWLGLPAEHTALRLTGLRFMLFDSLGLVLMGAAYLWLLRPK